MHIVSLVMGILSLLSSWIPVIGFVLAIVALVLAIIAMVVKKEEQKGKGMKIAGIILSIIATVIALFVTVSSVLLMKAASDLVDMGNELVDDAIGELSTMASSLQNQLMQTYDNKDLSGVQVRSAVQQHLKSTDIVVVLVNANSNKMLATVGNKKLPQGSVVAANDGYYEISSDKYSAEGGTLHKTSMDDFTNSENEAYIVPTNDYRSYLLKVSGTSDIVGIVLIEKGESSDKGSENNTNTNATNTNNNNNRENSYNEEIQLNLTKIQELNKESVIMYLSALLSGSPESRAQEIMGYSSYEEMESHYTDTVIDEIYKVTDIDYSSFKNKLSGLSGELVENLYSFKSETNLFKEHNGKLAIHQAAWTGSDVEFVSQQLISNKASEYTWKVIVKEAGASIIYNIIGKLENENYVLMSVSN